MVTASIVAYKTKESDLLNVIHDAFNGKINKIWIIDNSPSDDLRKYVEKIDNIEYIWGHGNIGYGAAHNIALNKAENSNSDYHVVLNPDISFGEEVIPALEAFMNRHKDVGYVMPKVYYPDGRLQFLCKLNPTPLDILGRRLFSESWIKKRIERFEMKSTGYNEIRNVPILSGCFMFLRMKSIKKVGYFDDRFFMYFEDFDLIRRIHKEYKTVFYPHVSILHNHAAEHHVNRKLLFISIKSAIRYFNKWGWIFDSYRRKQNRLAFDSCNTISDEDET